MRTQVTLVTVITDLAIHVGDTTIALSRSVELPYLCNPKAFCESLPHTGAQAISYCQPNFVTLFWWPHWLRQQVATDFPNILYHLQEERGKQCCYCNSSSLKLIFYSYWFFQYTNSQYFPRISSYCAVVLNAVFPEAAGREFPLHYNSEAMDQTLTNSHDITWQHEKTYTSNIRI